MARNWESRDRKIHKRKHGMRVDNRSIFVQVEQKVKRSKKTSRKAG